MDETLTTDVEEEIPEADFIGYEYIGYIVATLGILLALALLWKLLGFVSQKNLKKRTKWRDNAADWYQGSILASSVESFMVVITLVSCGIFLELAVEVSNINPKAGEPGFKISEYNAVFEQRWLIITELCLSILFALDYLVNFVLAPNKVYFIFSVTGIVEALSCIPAVVGAYSGFYFYGFLFLRFIRLYQALKYLKHYAWNLASGIMSQIVLLVFTATSLIFSAAGFIFVAENNTRYPDGQVENFLDAIYFVIVSLTTVGYGDIAPKSREGKIVVIGMIVIGIVLLPPQIQKLLDLIVERTDNAHKSFGGGTHVVALAHSGNAVIPFVQEFYHEDRKKIGIKLCLMISSKSIPREAKLKLNEPLYRLRVELLEGYAMEKRDLERAKTAKAAAVFLISDKLTSSTEKEDSLTVLDAFAVLGHSEHLPVYAQIINPKHKPTLHNAGVDTIVCINELRTGIIAQCTLCPGFSTFLSNLVQSYKQGDGKKSQWQSEYTNGMDNEVYRIPSAQFEGLAGLSFGHALQYLYETTGAVLIGIAIFEPQRSQDNRTSMHFGANGAGTEYFYQSRSDHTLKLNPNWSYQIKAGDEGLVIYEDESIIDAIALLTAEDCKNNTKKLKFRKPRKDFSSFSKYLNDKDAVVESKPQSLEAMTIDSVDTDKLKSYIIVIGSSDDISVFVQRLRSYSVKVVQPIVIMSPFDPEPDLWRKVALFPEIYFLKGVPSDSYDILSRAKAMQADSVIILSSPWSDQKDITVDALPITYYRLVKNGACYVLVNLVFSQNSRFLGSHAAKSDDPLINPYYACGEVYLSACLDTLLVQSYYNPYIVQAIEQFTSGRVFNFPFYAMFPDCEGITYGEVFRFCVEANLIPLAIYRLGLMNLRYVYSSPPVHAIMRDDDIITVLDTEERKSGFIFERQATVSRLKEELGKDEIEMLVLPVKGANQVNPLSLSRQSSQHSQEAPIFVITPPESSPKPVRTPEEPTDSESTDTESSDLVFME